MKPGVTFAQAQADIATVQARLGKQFPKPDAELTVETAPLKETIVGDVRDSLWLLYGSVSLLLLIACSNIAALLLARTADREHEISIRFSLGASRRAIVVQLLAEVFSLAILGSAAGLGIAAAAARAFHLLADSLPRAAEITLNWTIVRYSLVCAVATTLLCGLFPALRGTRRGLAHSLAQTGRTQTSTRNPLQWILVAVQVTLAVTLLIGAGLLLRSLQQLGRVSPGFDPSHVLTFQISGSWGETANMGALNRRIDSHPRRHAHHPRRRRCRHRCHLPGVPSLYQMEFRSRRQASIPTAKSSPTPARSPAATSIPSAFPCSGRILQKRRPATSDVLVNRAFASLYLGGAAIGHNIAAAAYNDFSTKGQIRGIVGDAREEGLNDAPVPTVYSCFSAPNPFPNYLVRTHGDPMAMAETIRRRIHQLDPNRSVYAMMPLEQHLDEASAGNRLRTILLSLFAATAVSLASIGLYGTLNYLGRMRQREVGVRLALGAARSRILTQFLFQGLRVTLIGCVAGLALSLASSRLVAGMLYGVSPLDPITYIAVLVLILAVATAASLFPAWRAARVDPVQILRQE